MATEIPTVTLAGKTFVILEQSEYERLRALEGAADDRALPALPKADAQGTYPAVEYARASLGRKLIRRRKSAGLTRAELARQARVRPETLARIEQAKSSPSPQTVEKIVRVLDRVEATFGGER